MTRGADGNVWFTEDRSKIGRITPGGAVTEYPIQHAASALTLGPDGNVWFYGSGRAGRVTPAGQVTEFEVPQATYAWGNGITAAADGNLWFIDSPGHSAFRLTPTGEVTVFDVRAQDANQFALAAGPGGTMWVTDSGVTVFAPPR
jgi:virginiamycin B lyase